jgi:hypothetical protein
MIKAYLKYCWFGFKALWQLIALGIFFSIAGLPLWGLEKILQTELPSSVRLAYAIFIGLPMLGAFFVWKSKQMWNADEISENDNKNSSNQKLDPTVKTPVESGKVQGTAGQL